MIYSKIRLERMLNTISAYNDFECLMLCKQRHLFRGLVRSKTKFLHEAHTKKFINILIHIIPDMFGYEHFRRFNFTKRVNMRSVIIDNFNVTHVPYYQINNNIISSVLNDPPVSQNMINFIPEDLIVPNHVIRVLYYEPKLATSLPEHLLTRDAIIGTISRAGYTIQFFPPHLITEEMIVECLSPANNLISYIPEHLRTKKVIDAWNKIRYFLPRR